MESHAYRNIIQGKRHLVTLRLEAQFTIVLSTPEQSTLSQFYRLKACNRLTFSRIITIQTELYLLSTDDSYGDLRFLAHL